MATIKSFTSVEQSRKLAKFLSPESADMCWNIDFTNYPSIEENIGFYQESKADIPCWSLAALLSVLPNDTSLLYFDDAYQMVYDKKPYVISNKFDNPVDACVAMIEKLNEFKIL